MSKPSNRRSKSRKKGRPARPPKQMAVRQQLRSALEAVEGLKGLETLSEAGPRLQKVYDTVVGLAPIMDAVIADHAAMNDELETLKQLVHTLVHGIDDPDTLTRAKVGMLEQLAPHMQTPDEEPYADKQ